MIELLLLHMQAQLVKLRDDERGDVLTTIVLILGFFLLAGIVLILLRFVLRTSARVAKGLLVAGVVLLVIALLLGMIGPLTP